MLRPTRSSHISHAACAALVAVALPAVVGCRAHVAAGSYRAGDSMLPTIAVGETVGVHAVEGAPPRGRVVVFRAPERPEQSYVKRVVGLPGDTISVQGNEVVLNGAPVPRCRLGGWGYTDAGGASHQGELWLERLDGTKFLVFHDAARTSGAPSGTWKVAPGEVFVLGDNRENSHDSRFWFGGKGGGLAIGMIVGAVLGAAEAGSEPAGCVSGYAPATGKGKITTVDGTSATPGHAWEVSLDGAKAASAKLSSKVEIGDTIYLALG